VSETRAARRRELRAAGQHRSAAKRGRRGAIRAAEIGEAFRSSLVIARSNIVMPTDAERRAALEKTAFDRVRRG